jgi:NADPH:quinone reductase-like Zn-dependent oxidoreductase
VRAAGADAAVNHREEGYLSQAQAALPDACDGKFDIVLEMAAHANLVADVSLLRRGGQVSPQGLDPGRRPCMTYALLKELRSCPCGGQLAIIGSKPAPIALNPRLLMPLEVSLHGSPLCPHAPLHWSKDACTLSLTACALCALCALCVLQVSIKGVFLPSASKEELDDTHQALYDEMARGALTPVVAAELPLVDAPTAHVDVMSTAGKAGNIVLKVR